MKWKKEHAINPIYYTFLTGPVCARFNSLRYKKIKKVLITRKTKQNKTKTMPLCDELSPQTPDLPPVP